MAKTVNSPFQVWAPGWQDLSMESRFRLQSTSKSIITESLLLDHIWRVLARIALFKRCFEGVSAPLNLRNTPKSAQNPLRS